MTCPVVLGSAKGWRAAHQRLVGAKVDHVDRRPHRQSGEVDDHIRALCRGQQHLVEPNGLGEEATLGTDHPKRQRRLRWPGGRVGRQLEEQEPGVAAIQQTEPIPPRLHLQHRPRLAIDDHGVGEELRVPDGRDVAAGNVRTLEVIEELPVSG